MCEEVAIANEDCFFKVLVLGEKLLDWEHYLMIEV